MSISFVFLLLPKEEEWVRDSGRVPLSRTHSSSLGSNQGYLLLPYPRVASPAEALRPLHSRLVCGCVDRAAPGPRNHRPMIHPQFDTVGKVLVVNSRLHKSEPLQRALSGFSRDLRHA